MIGRVEVSVANALEVRDLKFANDKLSCKPAFYKKKEKGMVANMLVIKTYNTKEEIIQIKLVRVSSEGNVIIHDRTSPYVPERES